MNRDILPNQMFLLPSRSTNQLFILARIREKACEKSSSTVASLQYCDFGFSEWQYAVTARSTLPTSKQETNNQELFVASPAFKSISSIRQNTHPTSTSATRVAAIAENFSATRKF